MNYAITYKNMDIIEQSISWNSEAKCTYQLSVMQVKSFKLWLQVVSDIKIFYAMS